MGRILVPALITLAVTILRLVGELQGWSPALFNRSAGGGFALVGISWLVLVFGAWFGAQLAGEGKGPDSAAKSLGIYVAALLAFAAIMFGLLKAFGMPTGLLGAFVVGSAVSLWIASRTWPALFSTLFKYAFAARIPVVIVMFFAIMGSWGTHYDVVGTGPAAEQLMAMSPVMRWVLIGVLPQLTLWIAFTVAVGGIAASIAAMIVRPSATSGSGR